MRNQMKAWVIKEAGGPDVFQLRDLAASPAASVYTAARRDQ